MPASSPLIKRGLQGIARAHVLIATPQRVRRSLSWDVLLGEPYVALSCGSTAENIFSCVLHWVMFPLRGRTKCSLLRPGRYSRYFVLLGGDVALYVKGWPLTVLQRHEVIRIKVRFRGHKGDQIYDSKVRSLYEQATRLGVRVPDQARAARPPCLWQSFFRATQRCPKAPPSFPCIDVVMTLEYVVTRGPFGHFAKR